MCCIIAAELIALGFFKLWPAPETSVNESRNIDFSEDVFSVSDVVMTQQASGPAAPPKPQIPIPKPTDKIIEEDIASLDLGKQTELSDSLSMEMLGGEGEGGQTVANPDRPPGLVRIVEPIVPDAAKKDNVKALINVNFLVDTNGDVEEASISQIKVYDKNTGEVKTVESIGYGLTEAVLNAALQWKFRPAKNNGKPVKSYVEQSFSIGNWN